MIAMIPDKWKTDDRFWAVGIPAPGGRHLIQVEAGKDADLCPLPKFWKRGQPKTITYSQAVKLAKRIWKSEPDVVLCHPDDTGDNWLKFAVDFEKENKKT